MKYFLVTSVLSTLLLGCSGGGDVATTGTAQNTTSSSQVVVSAQVGQASSEHSSVGTAALNIDPDFNFKYSSELSINIILAQEESTSVKVCRVDEDNNIMIYDCILSTRTSGASYHETLTLSNDITRLGMQVITISDAVAVNDYYWSRNSEMIWNVEI